LSPRPDVSEERRRQILEAAISVFSRQGFHKARMDDIVQESGLSKGTLYWYFESKDDIIIAILENLFEREFAGLEEILQAPVSVSERLLRFTEYSIADIQSMLNLVPLTYEFYSLAFRQETVRLVLRDFFRKYVEILEPVVQEGIDRGEFRPLIAKDVVMAIGALIEGTILLWVYDPDVVDLNYHGKTSIRMLLDGLKNPVQMKGE